MKAKLIVLAGAVLILLGIWVLIRPNLLMPAKRQDLEIHGQMVKIETRRVVGVPRPVSGLVIVCGVALILLSTQEF